MKILGKGFKINQIKQNLSSVKRRIQKIMKSSVFRAKAPKAKCSNQENEAMAPKACVFCLLYTITRIITRAANKTSDQ